MRHTIRNSLNPRLAPAPSENRRVNGVATLVTEFDASSRRGLACERSVGHPIVTIRDASFRAVL
jgi:hypothetical protein